MELQAKSAAGRPAKRYKIVAVNENRDFKRAYAKGKSSVGITASKKIGNAVQRNRSRRVIRAAFQSLLPRMDKNRNLDLIFVARGKTPFVKSTAVQKVMEKHLKEAGILR